jgi:3-hydroxymyristoyl/3-hydroxydecanoyl-(acyl carrier protein) dehydratase
MISDKPLLVLPHRDPFVFVSRLLERNAEGTEGVCEFDVVPELDCFRGHFPGNPVFPGVLQMESIGQSAIWIYFGPPESGRKLSEVLMASVENFKLRKPVYPGDTLRHECKQLKAKSGLQYWETFVKVRGEVVSKGTFWIYMK